MTDLRRAGSYASLLMLSTLLVAACGGAATPTATPTPTPEGGAPPPGATATPTPEQPVGEATPGEIPTFDLDALSGVIPGVDSYRTSFSIGGKEQYQSVVVTKPVLSKAITTFSGDGSVDSRFIIVGDDIWQAQGADGAFEVVPSELGSAMLMMFDPALMLGAFAGADLAGVGGLVGTEDKNGIQARHIRIDPTTATGFAASMPAGSAIDIWVADAGYLVGWEMTGFEADSNISIQVTGVNDPANKVEAPS